MEDRIWKKYQDKGVVVVGIDPGGRAGISGGASTDDIGGLQKFISNIHATFPIGVEETKNYLAFIQNYKGLNPFPVDVIVGKDGKIVYIAREYDPDVMLKTVEAELAK